jgi:hypothetical protein
MFKCFSNRNIGILKRNIFTNQSNFYALLRIFIFFQEIFPVFQISVFIFGNPVLSILHHQNFVSVIIGTS